MSTTTTARAVGWVEQGLVPDRVVRLGIRRLLKERLAEMHAADAEAAEETNQAFVDGDARRADRAGAREGQRAALRGAGRILRARAGPAPQVQQLLLGRRRPHAGRRPRPPRCASPASAPACADGQDILELGCGWGSLSLWMADALPQQPRSPRCRTRIRSAATSRSEAAARGLRQPARDHLRRQRASRPRPAHYDRVVSVEMFEHLRNWPQMFARVARLAQARRPLLHARVRAPRRAVRVRRARRQRLDEPPLLLRRHDARRRPRAALPGRPAPARALALGRHALPEDLRGLAAQHGRARTTS